MVTVTIRRNFFAPEWIQPNPGFRVLEGQELGVPLITTTARDLDRQVCVYSTHQFRWQRLTKKFHECAFWSCYIHISTVLCIYCIRTCYKPERDQKKSLNQVATGYTIETRMVTYGMIMRSGVHECVKQGQLNWPLLTPPFGSYLICTSFPPTVFNIAIQGLPC